MATSTPSKSKEKVVANGFAVTTGGKDTRDVRMAIPLPCITILVHGVNDVGEAYQAQETGLCKGLNARLDRGFELSMRARGDLRPSDYRMPPATDADRKKDGIKADPDAVYFRRTPDRHTWSPVIPFYWGSREEEKFIKKDNWHGQWTDRYGNRLDKNGAKNGGAFANATTTLNAMWGDGFNGKVAGTETAAEWGGDPLHQLKKACPRHYMLLAAKRLAMLIKMIRSRNGYENVAINLLCHSQGTMVAMAAHALLAEEGGNVSADTLIFQNSPYSLEEPPLERMDGVTGDHQQTTVSRIRTLSNIFRYVDHCKSNKPKLEDLELSAGSTLIVAGPYWKAGKGARQWVMGEAHTFTERDNRGKVYLYFCPHDKTVGLESVRGIGWQGIPDKVKTIEFQKTQQTSFALAKASVPPTRTVEVPALSMLGEGFRQRIFTSRKVNDKQLLVGAPPTRYEMRSKDGIRHVTDENSTTGNWSLSVAQIERGEVRQINGEELNPQVPAVLTTGENFLHQGKLHVSPIDAAIAVSAGTYKNAVTTNTFRIRDFRTGKRHRTFPLTPDEIRILETNLPNQRENATTDDDRLRVVSVDMVDLNSVIHCTYCVETANEARARWQNENFDENSYHSAIPANPAHAAGVSAYDLSLGQPLPISDEEKIFLEYLCAAADWRTDWDELERSKNVLSAERILNFYRAESTPKAIALIQATYEYHASGVLPSDIVEDGRVVLPRPKLISSYTVADRAFGKSFD